MLPIDAKIVVRWGRCMYLKPQFFRINPFWPSMSQLTHLLPIYAHYILSYISILFMQILNLENLEGTKITAYNFEIPKFLTRRHP